MLKVLIVDDEVIHREALKNAFDWSSVNCVVCGEAENATDAFELYGKLEPDIIITDIRMSKADGLQLIKMLKEAKANTEIIVLSGYDDFSYAKEALEGGVFAYLLKPLNLNELSKTIKAVKEKIENKQKTNTAVSAYTAIQTEQFIVNLINNSASDNDIAANNDLLKKLSNNYFVACVAIDNKNSLKSNLLNAALCLKETTDYTISTSENYIVKVPLEQTKCILTIFIKDTFAYDSAIASLNKLVNSFYEISGETITIGISGIFRNIKMLSKAYNQAEQALKFKATEGNNRIIDFIKIHRVSFGEYTITKEQINNIISYIKNEQYSKVKDSIHEYFSRIHNYSNLSIDSLKSNIAELAIMIINATANNTDIMQMLYGRIVNPVTELQNIELLSEVHAWIIDLVDKLDNSNSIYSKTIKNELVAKAVNYIITHYNRPITIEWVASQLYVSPRHISRCFKIETNMTFNEYLTNYRMMKAVNLLKENKYKIYEVAQLVGYNDSKYFCKLFKNVTGKTPKSYKP